ncbi:MAG: metallophosphoesterase [Cyclobacteriaceae bacterium]|nr:metallophosphoesterase [Cyclobacteriaceae bacterium]
MGATYLPCSSLYGEASADKLELKQFLESIPSPILKADESYDSSWVFVEGGLDEELNQDYKVIEGAAINLPHRINLPNQSLWYQKIVEVDAPGVLEISADDGAQLIVDGKRILRIHGNFFPFDFSGEHSVTIRVLNNAMFGGLNRVRYYTRDRYTKFIKDKEEVDEEKFLLQKALLIKNIDVNASLPAADLIQDLQQKLSSYPYIIGPYLIRRTDTVSIMAITDSNKSVELWKGSDSLNLTLKDSKQGGIVRFDLSQAETSDGLYYRLVSDRSLSAINYISTKETASYSFNVWADSQSGWKNFNQTLSVISQGSDAFGVGLGDLVSEGCDSLHWIQFFSHLAQVSGRMPFFLIPGNHDYDGYYDDLNAANHRAFTQSNPFQSWTFDNSAFIAIDPNATFPIGIKDGTNQYQWFQKEIESEKWKNATWRFVFLHQPPFSQGWEGYHGDQVIRDLLEPVLEKAKVDFVVCGHTHNYERWTRSYGEQRVTFLIVGGAGGSLEDGPMSAEPEMDTAIRQHHFGRFTISQNAVKFEAISHEGRAIDSYRQVK